MPRILDNQGITDHGWGASWFPLDTKAPTGPGVDAVEVQLVDKKHPLFGKVESAWKE